MQVKVTLPYGAASNAHVVGLGDAHRNLHACSAIHTNHCCNRGHLCAVHLLHNMKIEVRINCTRFPISIVVLSLCLFLSSPSHHARPHILACICAIERSITSTITWNRLGPTGKNRIASVFSFICLARCILSLKASARALVCAFSGLWSVQLLFFIDFGSDGARVARLL